MTTQTPMPAGDVVRAGRVDAYLKVLGAPLYAADRSGPDLLYAMLAVATVGKGRLSRIDTAAAAAVAGVRLVMTSQDATGLQAAGYSFADGYGYQSLQVMVDDHIAYRGQPIALVVADTLEIAVEATRLIETDYEPEPFFVTLDDANAAPIPVSEAVPIPHYADKVLGDADRAFADSEIQVDQRYETSPQHHNPMELIATVVEWRGDTLVVHEGTQNAGGVQNGLATVLGLDPAQVEVHSPYIGGSFGQKFALGHHTPLIALASRSLGRPIKLVRPRAQIFQDASFRPASQHRIRIGGDRSGRMVAGIHETVHQTSRHDMFPSSYTEYSATMYGWEHYRGHEDLLQLDTPTPGYMRCPYDHIAAFSLESAVDEFAALVGMDPVDLRLANDTGADAVTGLPFSSRYVAECLRRGSERFGWSSRPLQPGTIVADDGSLVGWGVALGSYPAQLSPSMVRLRLEASGQATVSMTGHEMGQGIRSVVTQQVAEALGLPLDRVEVLLGDTRAAPQHLTAGGWGSASSVAPLRRALDDILAQVRSLNGGRDVRQSPHEVLAAVGRDAIEAEARYHGPGQEDEEAYAALDSGAILPDGPVYPEFTSFSYVAQFVEVRIDPTTRRVRVPRVVSVVDCGRILNPVTATSQIWGGVTWGIGAALREQSEVDPRFGGVLNADIAEYVIPVNADIAEIDVEFINEPDQAFNTDGVKSLGNVVMSGVAAAIGNAIFHATGRRQRRLPIRLEDLL